MTNKKEKKKIKDLKDESQVNQTMLRKTKLNDRSQS